MRAHKRRRPRRRRLLLPLRLRLRLPRLRLVRCPLPIAGDANPTGGAAVAPPSSCRKLPPSRRHRRPLPPPPELPPAPADPEAELYKKINMGVWSRIGFGFQKADDPKKLDGVRQRAVKWSSTSAARCASGWRGPRTLRPPSARPMAARSNRVAHPGSAGGTISGALEVQDLIAQFEPDPLFNVWVGRHLVASDRSNFAGPYFMAPWIYPLLLGPQNFAPASAGGAYAVVGPKEGPYGRSDGATIWGQVGGGTFKYFLGAYDLYDAIVHPLISGRVSISLLNPEPGYWGTATYHGMDLFSIGVGGQYSKNREASIKPEDAGALADYGLINADLLFEKKLGVGGAFDLEGAFYKYVGDGESLDLSYMALVSYLTPELAPGAGKLQPLVRVQQAKQKSVEDGGGDNLVTQTDAQVNYVLDGYATRFALGYTHGSAGDGANYSNAVFLGVQLQK